MAKDIIGILRDCRNVVNQNTNDVQLAQNINEAIREIESTKEFEDLKSIVSKFTSENKSLLAFKINGPDEHSGTPNVDISLIQNDFVKYASLTLSDEFYLAFNEIAKSFRIKLSYNNTGTTCWINKRL